METVNAIIVLIALFVVPTVVTIVGVKMIQRTLVELGTLIQSVIEIVDTAKEYQNELWYLIDQVKKYQAELNSKDKCIGEHNDTVDQKPFRKKRRHRGGRRHRKHNQQATLPPFIDVGMSRKDLGIHD